MGPSRHTAPETWASTWSTARAPTVPQAHDVSKCQVRVASWRGARLGPPRIAPRGPRRPNDVEVLEVLATLDGVPPLVPGMRVDVFFKLDSTAQTAPQPKAN